jgi:hypothetical protein
MPIFAMLFFIQLSIRGGKLKKITQYIKEND